MRPLVLLLATLLAACAPDTKDDAGDADADGDGSPASVDCDDGDASVSPGADERCNGVDDNCDGAADEATATDAPAWYPDADGDGFGDGALPAYACEAPTGDLEDDTDCDDTDAAVHPGADDTVGDEVDSDCDGGETCYADADADGWGTADTVASADADCDDAGEVAADVLALGTDCDDGAAGTHPTADERCDGTDDDCDGNVDEAGAVDAVTASPDADGDGYGDPAGTTFVGCTPPAGYVTNATDCDDVDDTIHPAAAERCDGVDDDCDPATAEAGLATWVDADGASTDLTAALAGTAAAPIAYPLSDEGTLSLCEGTWYVNLTPEANVSVQGLSGDPATVVLDGGDAAPVVGVWTDGVDVALRDLTIQGGAATEEFMGVGAAGGGISCMVEGTPATVLLDDVTVRASSAYFGGGLFAYRCDTTLTDSAIVENSADFAAGVMVYDSALTMTGGEITDNAASVNVGGVFVGVFGATASGAIDGVSVAHNSAVSLGGGGAVADGATFTCTGDTATSAGFFANTDSAGGAGFVVSDATFTADLCDFGTTAGGDDNGDYDVVIDDSYAYRYGDDASFACDATLCGTETTYTLGGAAAAETTTDGVAGVTFLASSDGTLDQFAVWMTAEADACDGDVYVLSTTSTSGTWDVAWAGTTTASDAGGAWVSSGDIGLPVQAGVYYALVEALQCDGTSFYYSPSGPTADDVGMGTTDGGWFDGAYDPTNYETSVTSGFYAGDNRLYMQVNVSH
jgi:hypothetical protein